MNNSSNTNNSNAVNVDCKKLQEELKDLKSKYSNLTKEVKITKNETENINELKENIKTMSEGFNQINKNIQDITTKLNDINNNNNIDNASLMNMIPMKNKRMLRNAFKKLAVGTVSSVMYVTDKAVEATSGVKEGFEDIVAEAQYKNTKKRMNLTNQE